MSKEKPLKKSIDNIEYHICEYPLSKRDAIKSVMNLISKGHDSFWELINGKYVVYSAF